MTPEEVRVAVGDIKDSIGDSEYAHHLEDILYHQVVQSLARINDVEFTFFDLAELVSVAKIALETEDIRFARGCA